MSLSDEQKRIIAETFKVSPDLNEITRRAFDNPALDGRTKEGRLVRSYMIETGLKFNTSKNVKKEEFTFTDEQKEFIIEKANTGLSSFAIAEMVFPDREVKTLSMEQRSVFNFLKEINPDYTPSEDTDANLSNYVAPKSFSRIIKKINDSTGLMLEEEKINRQVKICADKLGVNLNNSRFIKIINNYTSREDRELFEQEFIRLTWDKPDLTSDEINLYMNVCKEIITLEVISKHLNKLNDLFDTATDNDDLTVRLSEIIKTKSSEYHQCQGRIESLTKKLQGDRAVRMQSKQKENASVIALVQFFQDEEERANMVHMAEMQKALVKEEAERLEGFPEWKARVLGISIDDVI